MNEISIIQLLFQTFDFELSSCLKEMIVIILICMGQSPFSPSASLWHGFLWPQSLICSNPFTLHPVISACHCLNVVRRGRYCSMELGVV